MPVRFLPGDELGEAGAVRDIDLQQRFPFSKTKLAELVGLTPPKAGALRAHLGIDGNDAYHHVFTFGHSTHDCYSHAALKEMRESIDSGLDMNEIWAANRPRSKH